MERLIVGALTPQDDYAWNTETVIRVDLERVMVATGEARFQRAAAGHTGGWPEASLNKALEKLEAEVGLALARQYRRTATVTRLDDNRISLNVTGASALRPGALFLVHAHGDGRDAAGPAAVVVVDRIGGEKADGRVVRQWYGTGEGAAAAERPGKTFTHISVAARMPPLDPAAAPFIEFDLRPWPYRRWDAGIGLRFGFVRDDRDRRNFAFGLGIPLHLELYRVGRLLVEGRLSGDVDMLFATDDNGDVANSAVFGVVPGARVRHLLSRHLDAVLGVDYGLAVQTGWWTTPDGGNSRAASWSGGGPKIEAGGPRVMAGLSFAFF